MKIASNTKINHIMVPFTNHYNAIFTDRFPSNIKLEKIDGTLITLFYVNQSPSQLQRRFFFIKSTKNNHSLASDWWENTKSSSKEDARTFFWKFGEILEFQHWKEDWETYKKKKI